MISNKPGVKDHSSHKNTRPLSQINAEDSDSSESVEEVYYGSTADAARFQQLKMDEFQKWKDYNAFEEVLDTGQPRLSCKWVCTEK